MHEKRDVLIERILAYFLSNGLAGLSLRPLAKVVGTSARMLVYHFGSREGLISAVMGEVQTRLQQSFGAIASPEVEPRVHMLRRFWDWTIHPDNTPYLRLLFEVQMLALQHPAEYTRYLKQTSSSWQKIIANALPPGKDNCAIATLCAAIIDGLLLEFLSTGESERTTNALDFFNCLMQNRSKLTNNEIKP